MSVQEVLLKLLDNLGENEMERFKFFLRTPESLEPFPAIPKSQVEKARNTDMVDIIFQTYNQKSTEVVKKILEKISRHDLVDEPVKRVLGNNEVDNRSIYGSTGTQGQSLHV